MLGLDARAMVLLEVHGDMKVLESRIGQRCLEECRKHLLGELETSR